MLSVLGTKITKDELQRLLNIYRMFKMIECLNYVLFYGILIILDISKSIIQFATKGIISSLDYKLYQFTVCLG